MRAYHLKEFSGPDGLAAVDLSDAAPGPGEVQVHIHAVSLNFRDLAMARGAYGAGVKVPLIPCSDAAGTVAAIGPGVSKFKVGDRVTPTFFQNWLYGDVRKRDATSALGGGGKGVLAERIVLHESGLLPISEHLSFEEAACLPCAALTAWHALFEQGPPLRAGETVLIQGSGGVSIFALQFAKLVGARVFATSSSDEKRKRLESLGVEASVNYKTTPEWDKAIAELAGGGVDRVVEVGGAGTLARSINAIRTGGRIYVIGVLAGPAEINPQPILRKSANIHGIFVGSREMFEHMNAEIVRTKLKPVVDRVFRFDEAKAAFQHLAAGAHFGKVCIRVG